MNKIAVAASVALALMGCATRQPPPMTGGPMAQVYVVTPAAQRLVVVDPDYIRVRPGSGVQTIVWRLATSGYSFPDDGISGFTPMLHGAGANQQLSPPAAKQFDCRKVNAVTFQCQYANQDLGRYKYIVKLSAGDGNDPPPLDPSVGND
jgi:hypothetical protein